MTPVEVERHLRRTATGCRAQVRDPWNRAQRDLNRTRNLGLHLRRVPLASIDRNDDARIINLGKQADRQPQGSGNAA